AIVALSAIHAILAAGREKEAVDREIVALGVSRPADKTRSGCTFSCRRRTHGNSHELAMRSCVNRHCRLYRPGLLGRFVVGNQCEEDLDGNSGLDSINASASRWRSLISTPSQ